ncbi:MAG: hypothetical protein LBL06_05830 [Treponema sp.]|jgi:hypothetical protein|nr:hypothetical protein [Treponema sp.]
MTGFDDDVRAFIAGDFLEQNVKFGDSFHIISFADAARMPWLETSVRVMGNDDMERIKRMIHNLARINTTADINGALAFAEEYIAGLGARQKMITIVTPASMPKTSLDVVKMGTPQPSAPPPLQEKSPEPPSFKEEPPTPSREIEPQKQEPRPLDSLLMEEEVLVDVPVEMQPPEEQLPQFTPPKIITPDDSSLPRIVRSQPAYRNRRFDSLTTPTAVFVMASVVVFLLCSVAIMFKCRRIRLLTNRAFASLSDNRLDGQCLLSLSVENQNTNIGRRNFHSVKKGFSLTVGGGNSDFLIFLTPLPPSLAKIHFDGDYCSFIPLKRWFFPEIMSKALPDCVGRTIRIKTEKNYDIFIRIVLHEAPLRRLNKLFNLGRLPGR